jgi:hypothetical protein
MLAEDKVRSDNAENECDGGDEEVSEVILIRDGLCRRYR